MSETLDKMYLEWSLFTQARTQREIDAAQNCLRIVDLSDDRTIVYYAASVASSLFNDEIKSDPAWKKWRAIEAIQAEEDKKRTRAIETLEEFRNEIAGGGNREKFTEALRDLGIKLDG